MIFIETVINHVNIILSTRPGRIPTTHSRFQATPPRKLGSQGLPLTNLESVLFPVLAHTSQRVHLQYRPTTTMRPRLPGSKVKNALKTKLTSRMTPPRVKSLILLQPNILLYYYTTNCISYYLSIFSCTCHPYIYIYTSIHTYLYVLIHTIPLHTCTYQPYHTYIHWFHSQPARHPF